MFDLCDQSIEFFYIIGHKWGNIDNINNHNITLLITIFVTGMTLPSGPDLLGFCGSYIFKIVIIGMFLCVFLYLLSMFIYV